MVNSVISFTVGHLQAVAVVFRCHCGERVQKITAKNELQLKINFKIGSQCQW